MSKARKIVYIVNPEPDSPPFTSVNRARRHVGHGLAVWVEVDSSIRFLSKKERASERVHVPAIPRRFMMHRERHVVVPFVHDASIDLWPVIPSYGPKPKVV